MFIVGTLLLIKGGDWFVDSSINIAKRFRVPKIIIGANIFNIYSACVRNSGNNLTVRYS